MGKAADDTTWLDELTKARESEPQPEELDHQERAQDSIDTKGQEPADDKPADHKDERQDDEQRTVPLATFLEERNQLNAKIDNLQQQLEEGGKSLAQLRNLEADIRALRDERAQHEETAPPDYLDDPQGYVDAKTGGVVEQLKSLGDQVKQTREHQEMSAQQMQQQRLAQQVMTAAAGNDEAFAKEHQDYYDALEHMRSIRRQQLQLTVPTATPQQIEQHVRAEEFNIAAQVISQGRNSAEYAYEMAKTLGYTPKQAGESGKSEDQEDLEQKMAEGRERAQGMGSGGSPPGGDIEELMGLNDDEFDQAMKEMFGR